MNSGSARLWVVMELRHLDLGLLVTAVTVHEQW